MAESTPAIVAAGALYQRLTDSDPDGRFRVRVKNKTEIIPERWGGPGIGWQPTPDPAIQDEVGDDAMEHDMDEIQDFASFTDPISTDTLTIGTDRSLDELDAVIRIEAKDEHGNQQFLAHYLEVTRFEARMLVDQLAGKFDGDEDGERVMARLRRLLAHQGG